MGCGSCDKIIKKMASSNLTKQCALDLHVTGNVLENRDQKLWDEHSGFRNKNRMEEEKVDKGKKKPRKKVQRKKASAKVPLKKQKKASDKGKEEQGSGDEEAEPPARIERVLFGDLVLCTDKNGHYSVCHMEKVINDSSLKFTATARVPPGTQPQEVFVDMAEGDAFAEPRYGFFVCTVVFAVDDDCLVYIHTMDPHEPASYAWFKESQVHPVRTFDAREAKALKVDDVVDVCRWEWQDNRQPVWCPATITKVENKERGLFAVQYQRPLRFKTEENSGKGWRYGKSKEITREENVIFSRLRLHKKN